MLIHAATVQPGDEPDTYYSNSDMTKSDGTVVFETSNHDQCVGNSSYLSTASQCGKLFAKLSCTPGIEILTGEHTFTTISQLERGVMLQLVDFGRT
jgi:hypothetical protein